jgi:hypothetical protein
MYPVSRASRTLLIVGPLHTPYLAFEFFPRHEIASHALAMTVVVCTNLLAALAREPDSGQHDRAACELERANRLAEQRPSENHRRHRLNEQAH